MVSYITLELITIWMTVVGYALAGSSAIFSLFFPKRMERFTLGFMVLGLVAHTVSLGFRWIRIEHVPVGNIYEALSANVWGMMVAVVLVFWRIPRVRPIAVVMLPIVMLVMGWMLILPPVDSYLPPTYDTVWLFIHIGFIKFFLGCALIALGLAGIILLREAKIGIQRLARMPESPSLDELAYRFMALALIFDALGVIAGAIWARDAWGRYWSWDPLETWSLITWLSIGFAIHVRTVFQVSLRIKALLIVGVFMLAFLTFFGVPFVSNVVHKGAV